MAERAQFPQITRFRAVDGLPPGRSATGVIGPDLRVIGEVQCAGTIVIEGVVEGSVYSRHVTVGEGAYIEGSILAESIHINGTVYGPVEAIEVSITKGARVAGTITHNKLSIERGAIVEGLRPWRPPPDWK